MAAKRATATIPIVFGLAGDAVGADVVPSLRTSDGERHRDVTVWARGVAKGLELLKEAVVPWIVMTRRLWWRFVVALCGGLMLAVRAGRLMVGNEVPMLD